MTRKKHKLVRCYATRAAAPSASLRETPTDGGAAKGGGAHRGRGGTRRDLIYRRITVILRNSEIIKCTVTATALHCAIANSGVSSVNDRAQLNPLPADFPLRASLPIRLPLAAPLVG
jgi:hypothetical protein